MNVIKRHKGLAIITLLTLILFVILFIVFSRMIFSTGKGEYGDRLNNLTPISDTTLKEAKEKLTENEHVKNATVRVQGKIVYIVSLFDKETSKSQAKELAASVLDVFEDETKEIYDFQILLNQEKIIVETESDDDDEEAAEPEDTSFAIAGAKHAEADKITWIKD